MTAIFDNKTILITGGTGSFGKRFVKHILSTSSPTKVIVFSRDELKQHHLEKELSDKRVRFFIGDIRDISRLQRAFAGVDIVVHAAALKQVPALEYNPFEAVKTNVIGSQNVIEAAIDQKVSQVLLISSDKAAHPINLYGSTKLCAEKLFVAGNSYASETTRLSVVRYGNVIGSRGSIVDMLLRSSNGPIPVTHLGMTRFWINFNQAFNLVTFALQEMVGGEIFIPKLPSMRLAELLDVVVPGKEQKIIGIRPGEKLHESLVTEEEADHTIELGQHYVILPQFSYWGVGQYDKYLLLGKQLEYGFSFRSDNTSQLLGREELTRIVDELRREI